MNRKYEFETRRLIVDEWHEKNDALDSAFELADFVVALLSPAVTRNLPVTWQGDYSIDRARQWISERERECTILLAVRRDGGVPVGLVILGEDNWPDIHLGFLLVEAEWGQGLASELLEGFLRWCRESGVRVVSGGVARDNAASQRVLEKLGFVAKSATESESETFFELNLADAEM